MTLTLTDRFRQVRGATERLAEPLEVEDTVVQTMPDVSPTKWHLAHVTWFFEAFVLGPYARGYRAFDRRFHYLFNSYYQTVGEMHPRAQRGLLSRPTLADVRAYRAHVDAAVVELLDRDDSVGDGAGAGGSADPTEIGRRVELGLHHEQQHQELLLMDCKHVLGTNPLRPAYRGDLVGGRGEATEQGWIGVDGGLCEFGAETGDGFQFDNETPRHRAFVAPFALGDRLVSNGDWAQFVEDGGYRRSELWLADGWTTVGRDGWEAPLYWGRDEDGGSVEYTLGGARPIDAATPVVHVSYYEADAFARWAGARLPTEHEWELVASERELSGNFVESDRLHPEAAATDPSDAPRQLFGDVWEWTASAYQPYPGFRPLDGSLGEYNGKFMCGQQVLRGGSCATPRGHLRVTYRNFFYPHQRWAFAGLRLARDAR